ncbi:DoxX family protein [Aestuariimicrobium ganziense]|uniref:DoxX family protein n=1 Tax=Aestuariimicrobium ganziense TaxID=2773677 RepID=UPI002E2E66DD|nr:DoxX family protein [Aestuariimicrobium ganziense]
MSVPSSDSPARVASSSRVKDVIGLVARLILGGVLLYAGLSKVGNLEQSVLAVRAYQLLPWDLAAWVGYGLPVFEIILGLLILVGLFTRWTALMGALVMVAFIFGISWAWAKGLSIDCGCFGDGGTVDPGQTQYPQDIVRDLFFVLAGAWLVVRPRSLFAADKWLFGWDDPLTTDGFNDLDEDDDLAATAAHDHDDTKDPVR